ncbi:MULTISPECIES: hypothetical protein [Burkholderia]|jgi:hypothetical protein|uniref:Uncharacterized protein n=2 Tax=Burkholderia cepacia complex TaxID=87882 RepID=A0A250LLA0_9BURK|nr:MULTISPECIES: hypothetical protein [Burkholderia]MBA9833701.1 hypothetical protein [Burkholderia contaminans]MBA9909597.1 hypothetical protein [Burkholderia contaminans]MBR8290414.1 hypothetical protein [Burkholderia cenocepacia]MBX3826569.1 hypothetical protein [Burkholderia contaminans]MBX3845584.1 hypothetical protein [Burkholderia contaminans]
MHQQSPTVSISDLDLPEVPGSLRGRLEVDTSAEGHPQIGIVHDGVLITAPYYDVGMTGHADPSEYGLSIAEADFLVAANERLTVEYASRTPAADEGK